MHIIFPLTVEPVPDDVSDCWGKLGDVPASRMYCRCGPPDPPSSLWFGATPLLVGLLVFPEFIVVRSNLYHQLGVDVGYFLGNLFLAYGGEMTVST